MLKNLALALAIGYTIFLTVLSLISLKGVPKLGSSFDDKIYHFGAYMVLTLLWYNFLNKTQLKRKILFSTLFVISYGIIVEVLQGALTPDRVMDAADVLANSLGVTFAIAWIFAYRKIKLK